MANHSTEMLQHRTRPFALRIIRMSRAVPRTWEGEVIGRQVLRAGTSVGANYRAACRSRSVSDMIAKLKIVEEEADESIFWMEMLIDASIMSLRRLAPLIQEGNEILAMVVASLRTLRRKRKNVQAK